MNTKHYIIETLIFILLFGAFPTYAPEHVGVDWNVSITSLESNFNTPPDSSKPGVYWYFTQKVRKAMASSQKYPLSELVQVDEFTVGGKEKGKQGRSYDSKKKKAVIAIELNKKHQIKSVYVKSIDDYSAKSLTPIFEETYK